MHNRQRRISTAATFIAVLLFGDATLSGRLLAQRAPLPRQAAGAATAVFATSAEDTGRTEVRPESVRIRTTGNVLNLTYRWHASPGDSGYEGRLRYSRSKLARELARERGALSALADGRCFEDGAIDFEATEEVTFWALADAMRMAMRCVAAAPGEPTRVGIAFMGGEESEFGIVVLTPARFREFLSTLGLTLANSPAPAPVIGGAENKTDVVGSAERKGGATTGDAFVELPLRPAGLLLRFGESGLGMPAHMVGLRATSRSDMSLVIVSRSMAFNVPTDADRTSITVNGARSFSKRLSSTFVSRVTTPRVGRRDSLLTDSVVYGLTDSLLIQLRAAGQLRIRTSGRTLTTNDSLDMAWARWDSVFTKLPERALVAPQVSAAVSVPPDAAGLTAAVSSAVRQPASERLLKPVLGRWVDTTTRGSRVRLQVPGEDLLLLGVDSTESLFLRPRVVQVGDTTILVGVNNSTESVPAAMIVLTGFKDGRVDASVFRNAACSTPV